MTINEKLKKEREQKEISLSELSKKTNIPKSTLQRYEVGTTKKIPLDAIAKIESALSLASGYFTNLNNASSTSKSAPADDDITFDDFTYAMYNETKELTEEDKDALLNMARILKKKIAERDGEI